MNNRKLFILTATLGVVALGLTLFSSLISKRNANWGLPETREIVSLDTLRSVKQVTIKEGGELKVTLHMNDSKQWTVAEYHDLNMDRSRMDRLISSLRDAEITRFVTRNEDKATSLQIGQIELALFGEDEKLLDTIKFGKDGKNGGKFVQRMNDDEVYFSDFSGTIDVDPKDWVHKSLFDLESDELAKLSFSWTGSDESIDLERPSKEAEYTLIAAAANESLNQSAMEQDMRTLFNARFSEALIPSETTDLQAALDAGYSISVETFTGEKFDIRIGRYTTVETIQKEDGTTEEKETHGPVYMQISANALVKGFPQSVQDLVFEMSDYTFTSLPGNKDEWISVAVEEEATDDIEN